MYPVRLATIKSDVSGDFLKAKDIAHIVWFEMFRFVSNLAVGGNGNGKERE